MILAVIANLAGCGSQQQPSSSQPQVTYSRDIAPITFSKCVVCHRPEGAAPFSLLTYEDTERRAQQIVDVTQSRYMPPWLPGDSDHRFAGDRRLSADQIALIKEWVATGKTEGNLADLPATPKFSSQWTLGEPDLLLEMANAYERGPSETDTWRNFVLPYNGQQTVYVRAYDFDPGNDKAVHHAVITVDRTGSGRQLDATDNEPGFDGMSDGQIRFAAGSQMPDGQTLGWTPGKVAHAGDDDIAWRLEPGSDLILQLHIPASGKSEAIRSKLALYLADRPPTRQPFSIQFALRDIDIPANEQAYRRTLSYKLPVAVEVTGLYPHAHYVCREMFATAEFPDGTKQTLLHIPDWNFDWQDDYRFEAPVVLPAGTNIAMEYLYDNSTANVRNPFNPPRRVLYGEQSTDSMGDLAIQVIPRVPQERQKLKEDFIVHQFRRSLNKHLKRLEREPESPRAHVGVGEAHLLLRDAKNAVKYLKRAIELGERDPRTYANLAAAYRLQRNFPAYAAAQRQAVEGAPANTVFRRDLANAFLQMNMLESAEPHYRRLVEQDPNDVASLSNIGMILGRQGQLEEAARLLTKAVELEPSFATGHLNLAVTYRNMKSWPAALKHLERANALKPGNPTIQKLLTDTKS
ncbi:MAG: tetratricopeptide repeat protein, partial [Planctomycetota bacterium]